MTRRQAARKLRHNATDAERALWRQVRAARLGGHKFRRQTPIGRYIVDFVCFEACLIVEVDGGQHADRQRQDAQRSAWLASQGFRVLRFWNTEVLGEMEAVKAVIAQACAGKPPLSLTPSCFDKLSRLRAGSLSTCDAHELPYRGVVFPLSPGGRG